MQPEAEAGTGGGGGGARAAARFAAGRASDDAGPAALPKSQSSRVARRNSWVPDTDSPQRLSDVSSRSFRQNWRLRLPGEAGLELGRVLGGGVVPGSLVLVGGEPGVGKSTLLLQVADMLTSASAGSAEDASSTTSSSNSTGRQQQEDVEDGPVLYVSGEESTEQIGSRAERMGVGTNADIFLYRWAHAYVATHTCY